MAWVTRQAETGMINFRTDHIAWVAEDGAQHSIIHFVGGASVKMMIPISLVMDAIKHAEK